MMIKNKKVLAIIPARAGSKRLVCKNKKKLYGKPLILWAIDAAKKSKYIDKIVVSSNDNDCINIAYNNKVPTQHRPTYLSTDDAKPADVIKYVTRCFYGYDIVVWLQPTSPLRLKRDIDTAIYIHHKTFSDSVVSVNEQNEHNGAVYVLKKEAIKDIDTCENSLSFMMPNCRSVDIDTMEDFKEAELCMQRRKR